MLTEELIRQKIAENNGRGVTFEGISNEDYHTGPGISSSDIKALVNGSLNKWLYSKKNPKNQTPALELGTMIHTYVLENSDFWNRYFREEEVPSAPPRNTTVGKDLFKEWSIMNSEILEEKYKGKLESDQWQKEYLFHYVPELRGKNPIKRFQLEIVEGIYQSIMNHDTLPLLLKKEDCRREVSLYWIDKETDELCKCRPDIENFKWPCILDLKSCQDAGLDAFEVDITNRDMHVSAWWYLWGASEVYEVQYDEFIYIPCEKVAPFEVNYYPADIGSLAVGEGLCRAGLKIVERHRSTTKTGTRATKSVTPKPAGIKPYAMNKLSQVIYANDLQNMNLERFLGVM